MPINIFTKLLLLAFGIVGSLTACAEPRYENIVTAAQGNSNKAKTECPLEWQTLSYCLSWNWEIPPESMKEASLVFKIYRLNVYDQSPVPVDFSTLPEVKLFMPAMGHGAGPTSLVKLDVGTYRVTDILFFMPGEWEIHFLIKDDSNVQDQVAVRLTL